MELDVPVLDVDQLNSPSSSSSSSSQQQIDSILDECLRYSARRPIMRQFDPASRSIWRQWRGTVVSETWKPAAFHALLAIALFLLFQKYPKCTEFLDGFNKIWSEVLAVTTFTLTFFVNEAYGCWRNCLNICYNLQGKMNGLSMVFAGCAKRASVSEEVEEYDRLAYVHKIYLGSFGTREGADLIKEKIRLRLIKSKRFAVVERQDQADAVLTGSAHVEESYYGSYSGNSGSGSTRYSATGVLRLVNVKNSETVWLFEYVSGHRHRSASSAVARPSPFWS